MSVDKGVFNEIENLNEKIKIMNDSVKHYIAQVNKFVGDVNLEKQKNRLMLENILHNLKVNPKFTFEQIFENAFRKFKADFRIQTNGLRGLPTVEFMNKK